MGVKLKVLKKCVVTKWSPFGHHSISVVKKGAQNHKSGQNFQSLRIAQALDITAIKKPQSIDWGFWNMVGII